eukprot:177048-Hanusia_phi.AAC.1
MGSWSTTVPSVSRRAMLTWGWSNFPCRACPTLLPSPLVVIPRQYPWYLQYQNCTGGGRSYRLWDEDLKIQGRRWAFVRSPVTHFLYLSSDSRPTPGYKVTPTTFSTPPWVASESYQGPSLSLAFLWNRPHHRISPPPPLPTPTLIYPTPMTHPTPIAPR